MDIMQYIEKIVKHHLYKDFLEVKIVPTYFHIQPLYGENCELLVHSNKNYIRISGFFEEEIIYTEEYNYVEILDKFTKLDQITIHTYPDDVEGTDTVKNSIIKDRRDKSVDDLFKDLPS